MKFPPRQKCVVTARELQELSMTGKKTYTRKELKGLFAEFSGSTLLGPLYWFSKDRSLGCLTRSGAVRVVRVK